MGKLTTQLGFPEMETEHAAIIGLVGRRGSGKDTFAKVAEAAVMGSLDPFSVVTLALGGFVKLEVAKLVGHSTAWVEEHKEQLRPLLQAWGTEFRRNLCDEDYWLTQLDESIGFNAPKDSILIITDVRFENEFDYIRARGGVIVRVENPRLVHDDPVDYHPSETWCDTCRPDAVFVNDAPMAYAESMRKGVEKLLLWAVEAKDHATATATAETPESVESVS